LLRQHKKIALQAKLQDKQKLSRPSSQASIITKNHEGIHTMKILNPRIGQQLGFAAILLTTATAFAMQ
jgi:hypothetical protein